MECVRELSNVRATLFVVISIIVVVLKFHPFTRHSRVNLELTIIVLQIQSLKVHCHKIYVNIEQRDREKRMITGILREKKRKKSKLVFHVWVLRCQKRNTKCKREKKQSVRICSTHDPLVK